MKRKTGIILHGKPSREKYFDPTLLPPSQRHWIPGTRSWLEEQGYEIATPDVPHPYDPVYGTWVSTLESHRNLVSGGILIGHSMGGDFFLRWLSENVDLTPDQLVLIGLYLDPNGKYPDFSQFDIDPRLTERIGEIVVVNSLDDTPDIQESVRIVAEALPAARVVNLNGFGHFMIGNAMTSPEFPELLEQLRV